MPAVPDASWEKDIDKKIVLPTLWNLHSGSKKSKCLVTLCSECIGGKERASVWENEANEQGKSPNQGVPTLVKPRKALGKGKAMLSKTVACLHFNSEKSVFGR